MKRVLCLALLLFPLLLSGCVLNTILNDVVNGAPTAVIDADPSKGNAPLTVNFDAQYSHDEDGSIMEYHWNFGDPSSTGSVASTACEHTYPHPGTYLVKLTVIDDDGAVDSQQIAVVVLNSPPVAQASVNNENPFPGDRVIFDATASYDLQGSIESYDWDFGDGSSGSGATAEHTYIEGGYYVVTLTVTDEAGDSASTHLGMNVQPGQSQCGGDDDECGVDDTPYAIITGLPSCSGGKVGVPIRLDGTSSRPAVGKIVTYHWDFGDGATASGGVVEHTYTTPWTYIITLTVTDEGGGVDTAIGSCPIEGSTCMY